MLCFFYLLTVSIKSFTHFASFPHLPFWSLRSFQKSSACHNRRRPWRNCLFTISWIRSSDPKHQFLIFIIDNSWFLIGKNLCIMMQSCSWPWNIETESKFFLIILIYFSHHDSIFSLIILLLFWLHSTVLLLLYSFVLILRYFH